MTAKSILFQAEAADILGIFRGARTLLPVEYFCRLSLNLSEVQVQVRDARDAISERSAGERPVIGLLQYRLMKLVPVIQVIEIHCVFGRVVVVLQGARAEDFLAGFVVVNVSAHRRIVFFNRLTSA